MQASRIMDLKHRLSSCVRRCSLCIYLVLSEPVSPTDSSYSTSPTSKSDAFFAECRKRTVSTRTFLNEIYNKTVHVGQTIPRSVVVFGQAGSGKSSIINMLAGSSVANVSPGAAGCTSSSQPYRISHGDDNCYTLWDTPGLNEAEDGTVSPQDAVHSLLDLVKDHGVNLLIYCIRGRLVDIIRVNYDLFWKIICMEKVPIVLVVTGLEGKPDMNEWWEENEKTVKKMKLKFAGHACVTSWKGKGGMYENAYKESAEKVWELVRKHSTPQPWHMMPGWSAQAKEKVVAYEMNYKARLGNGMRKFLRELARSIFSLTR